MKPLRWLGVVALTLWTYGLVLGYLLGVRPLKRLILVWPEAWPGHCALRAFQRMWTDGGGVVWRPSRYTDVFHCLYVDREGQLWGWNPPRKVRQRLPLTLFHGTWQRERW